MKDRAEPAQDSGLGVERGHEGKAVAAMSRNVWDVIQSQIRTYNIKEGPANSSGERLGAGSNRLGSSSSRAMVSHCVGTLDPMADRRQSAAAAAISTMLRDARYDCDNLEAYPEGLKQK